MKEAKFIQEFMELVDCNEAHARSVYIYHPSVHSDEDHDSAQDQQEELAEAA